MDDKIFLTDHFDTFVNVSVDTIVLPKFLLASDGYVVATMNESLEDRVIQNALMWSRPRHLIWEHIIRKQVKNVQNRMYGFTPYDITGTSAMYWGLVDYLNSCNVDGDDSSENDRTPDSPQEVALKPGCVILTPRRDIEFYNFFVGDAPRCDEVKPRSRRSES